MCRERIMKLKKMIFIFFFLPVSSVFAGKNVIDSGDTAWVMVSTALVMMMTPAGLALFYGGMSRYKNLLNTLAMTFVAYCLSSVVWMMWGYTLAFGSTKSGIVGGLNHFLLSGIHVGSVSGTIPTYVFVLFQMTFGCITVALVLGSVVDRMKFSSWIVFTVLWITFIYSPIAHWVWGGGWMGDMGALNFAGGAVVVMDVRRMDVQQKADSTGTCIRYCFRTGRHNAAGRVCKSSGIADHRSRGRNCRVLQCRCP